MIFDYLNFSSEFKFNFSWFFSIFLLLNILKVERKKKRNPFWTCEWNFLFLFIKIKEKEIEKKKHKEMNKNYIE